MVESSVGYTEFVLRVLVATLAGVLIGIERERMQLGRPEARARSIPGVRSFGLISIYGCLAALTSTIIAGGDGVVWSVVFTASTLGLAIFLLMYIYTTMSARRAPGITTYMVILVAYMTGALAGVGRLMEATSIGVLATLLLALKSPAVALARAISYEELIAIMEVAVLALIVGPLVAAYAPLVPWIDVYRVYLFFLLVLALSLASYGAARIWGVRGLVYGVTLGSMVNSEATIASATRLLGTLPEGDARVKAVRVTTPLIIGVMQARASILALVSIALFAGPRDLLEAAPLALLALVSSAVAAASFARGVSLGVEPITVRSPLSWYTAVKAALTYTALILASKMLELLQAPGPAYIPLAVLGGFANATATIIGLASVLPSLGVVSVSALTLIAIASATLNKIVYSDREALGGESFKLVVYMSLAMSLVPLALAVAQLAIKLV